ncbi:MAG: hypothetical protein NZM00_14500 [Anaerolinea sp.]|nr:hypothetical protein [Anaerolinea sp.]
MATPDIHTILDKLHGYIRREIAAGFESPAAIIESAVEYLGDEASPAILRPHAQRLVREILAAHLAEQATWPAITDCDRLDAAFAALEAGGIVCRQNFSCCGTCGAYEIWDEAAALEAAGTPVRGYAFYHVQDTESAVEGYGLYLSYGAATEGEAAALAIADEIVAALRQQGLRVDWNGQWSRRIGVLLDWKRRREG